MEEVVIVTRMEGGIPGRGRNCQFEPNRSMLTTATCRNHVRSDEIGYQGAAFGQRLKAGGIGTDDWVGLEVSDEPDGRV